MNMRRIHGPLSLLGLAGAVASLAGCGDSFLNEEMHLGNEAKMRPIAVTFEPPEASPGETVTATLLRWDPNPAGTTAQWRASLDFDIGLYGSDPREANVVELATLGTIGPAVDDGNGFVSQSVTFTVPPSTLVGASSLDPLFEDDLLADVARELLPDIPPAEVDKEAVNGFLAGLTVDDLAGLDTASRDGILAVADLFACEIRLRVTLESDIVVDVTRNLTVRHSRRLGSENVNQNPVVTRWEVVGVASPDFDWDDLDEFDGTVERWSFLAAGGDPPEVRVPRRDGWTYYLTIESDRETYASPFSTDRSFEENVDHRWYWFHVDDPGNGFVLFRDDEGEETDMEMLDDNVRFEPPGGAGEVRFRVYSVVRDERLEWERYGAAPGLTVAVGEVVFE